MKRQALGTLLALAVTASLVAWPGAPAVASTRPPLGTEQPRRLPPRRYAASTGRREAVVAMHGLAPSADLLGRIQRGEVGGVILFGAHITSAPRLVGLTRQLQQAALLVGGRHC